MQKNSVMREAMRAFNSQPLNPPQCVTILTSIMFLMHQGEEFTREELRDLFFACTKLFQTNHMYLRRMVYLVTKQIAPCIPPSESLIIINCLNKDMISTSDVFRANATRVMPKVMDGSMVANIERFLKQSVVDRNPLVVTAALVAGAQFLKTAPEVIKRWTAELQQALESPYPLVQFHALSLIYRTKMADRVGFLKVLAQCSQTQTAPRATLPLMLQVRTVARQLRTEATPTPALLVFLFECLNSSARDATGIVTLEAARGLAALHSLSAAQMQPVVVVLASYLASNVAAARFAAVRTLADVVTRWPALVVPYAAALEKLVADPNRSVATYAVTTLLKAGAEGTIDRLLKSLVTFIAEVNDDFRIVLIDSIRDLGAKFPHKHAALLRFLLAALRVESEYADKCEFLYQRAVVDCMLGICDAVTESREVAVDTFAEVIEDCEFPELSVAVLNKLAEVGPLTQRPARLVRFVFNRVLLEKAAVRAAAVTTLARFGLALPALAGSIADLLARCLTDSDDEVRDRATMYLALLRPASTAAPGNTTAVSSPVAAAAGEASVDASADETKSNDNNAPSVSNAAASTATATVSAGARDRALKMLVDPIAVRRAAPAKATFAAAVAATPNITYSSASADAAAAVPAALVAPGEPAAWGGPSLPALADLRHSLQTYLAAAGASDEAAAAEPFSLKQHFVHAPVGPAPLSPAARSPQAGYEAAVAAATASAAAPASAAASAAAAAAAGDGLADTDAALTALLAAARPVLPLDALAQQEPLWRVADPVPLATAELAVEVTKYVFKQHVVCAFKVVNNLPDASLAKVAVALTDPSGRWVTRAAAAAPAIAANGGAGIAYVVLAAADPLALLRPAALSAQLNFTMVTADGGEDADEYQLEPVALRAVDAMRRLTPANAVGVAAFKQQWEAAGAEREAVRKLSVPASSLSAGVALIVRRLGMMSCDGAPIAVPAEGQSHVLMAQGLTLGGHPAIARLGFIFDGRGVTFKCAIRAPSVELAEALAQGLLQ